MKEPRRRLVKRRKIKHESEDDFEAPILDGEDEVNEGMITPFMFCTVINGEKEDFIVPDDSEDEEAVSYKRKKPSNKRATQGLSKSSRNPLEEVSVNISPHNSSGEDLEGCARVKLAARCYDQSAAIQHHPVVEPSKQHSSKKGNVKEEVRRSWLATILDAERHPVDHPDYDPRTVYVPPQDMADLTPFEKQYWEIKKNLWDTIVFFKKGKFYELYEHDATIGNQLFDLKLTDRVNMRMVGVPESTLQQWSNQFIAKGYKVAVVDQKETALGKEMRERESFGKKEEKIIKRELSHILTCGTLVDGNMLPDDMATYCVAIKESLVDDQIVFGIAMVDAATSQFSIAQFTDDVDLTKFETFVAQTRPQELILEKSCISTKAMRILKNNTSLTTLWHMFKPEKEFWTADRAVQEINAGEYFTGKMENEWPSVLQQAKEQETAMSAFGALLQHLRVLKLDADLISLGNFQSYNPIRKASNLVLDGQTLINLEVFANTYDGGADGTLFQLLNHCVTPFGKRLFKQWICHPLADAKKINARLDAVEALNADTATKDRFTGCLAKMPDLERLISRIHAKSCKVSDFVKVLDGFEQIDYTMQVLGQIGDGQGLLGQLVSSMPDLQDILEEWKTKFDYDKARREDLIVPTKGKVAHFDESQDTIKKIEKQLNDILIRTRKDLKSNKIEFRNNGKEIYQLEVPISVKGVPKDWNQMSATKAVKRYYFPELKRLVRDLEEALESHGQLVRDLNRYFFAEFDEHYEIWKTAIELVARLDCLMSLAKASSSLGEPACRPIFVDEERSVLEFEELRHPCMLSNNMDFIPNDVRLGGDIANINVLTGANAAGKSTILRMASPVFIRLTTTNSLQTCIAVIMAQIGCYVPCSYARLNPVDRVMSRLGANDNIFAAQSTFFVELSETKKILAEATPRSLVILDELGRGTSSYDGVAVAEAVLHHIASHIGCIGFFATHYHSLAEEFKDHPEIRNKRMRILVDKENRKITPLYKLEDGIAEGSFGMHCASMCGIPEHVVVRAEQAATAWEHTSRLKESLEQAREGCYIPLGLQSDVASLLSDNTEMDVRGLEVLRLAIEAL